MLTEFEYKLFVLGKLRGVGPRTLRAVMVKPSFRELDLAEFWQVDAKIAKALRDPSALDKAREEALRDMEEAKSHGDHILCFAGERFPKLLGSTVDCPAFLYLRGSIEAVCNTKSIAIIGTREPTRHGAMIAHRVSMYFASGGWNIVSGLALGCDTFAHKAALEVGGSTVAVLAHGLHTIAPRQNAILAEKIVEKSGALLTEYSYGVDPNSPQFVKRDRIQAGLAKGVVMIQSSRTGGSLHASRASIKYGRFLAVPFPTQEDSDSRVLEIQANWDLCGEDISQKLKLLGCGPADLEQVLILRSKDDYPLLVDRLSQITA